MQAPSIATSTMAAASPGPASTYDVEDRVMSGRQPVAAGPVQSLPRDVEVEVPSAGNLWRRPDYPSAAPGDIARSG